MTVRVFSIHPMHHWFTLGVGFNAEGLPPVAVRLHLIGIESLNVENLIFHPLNHIGAVGAVVGQKVNHPHRTGFADVQVRRRRSGVVTVGVLI